MTTNKRSCAVNSEQQRPIYDADVFCEVYMLLQVEELTMIFDPPRIQHTNTEADGPGF